MPVFLLGRELGERDLMRVVPTQSEKCMAYSREGDVLKEWKMESASTGKIYLNTNISSDMI